MTPAWTTIQQASPNSIECKESIGSPDRDVVGGPARSRCGQIAGRTARLCRFKPDVRSPLTSPDRRGVQSHATDRRNGVRGAAGINYTRGQQADCDCFPGLAAGPIGCKPAMQPYLAFLTFLVLTAVVVCFLRFKVW
jgi:hypothetical protein